MMNHLRREFKFMVRQRYVLVLLMCCAMVSGFSIYTGINEVNAQRQTIERLVKADEQDRTEIQSKYDSPGYLAYYSFHLTYAAPSNLAFAALGQRDIYSWKHRIRMLALEGQIYESDSQNAELAQAGKIDFVFVISALAPLFLILLFHDLLANERASERHNLLVTTASSPMAFWGARAVVRFVAVFICLHGPFYLGAVISNTPIVQILAASVISLVYLLFWTALSLYLGRRSASAPRIASVLIAFWVMVSFVIPIVGDLIIKQSIESPQGGDILLTQRESVNDAWDLPVEETMQAFFATHPDYRNYSHSKKGFDWGWYYAFQQLGDQAAAELSADYRKASLAKYQLAGYVTILSPPILLQRLVTRLAETDAVAAFEYEAKIREFHQQLRHFYYPWLFIRDDFSNSKLEALPQFTPSKGYAAQAN